nr:hypothetical protein [Acidobacteriota bacterium]
MPMWQIPLLLLMIAGAVPDPFGQNARFSPGHDPRWAQPDFQDDSWSLAPLNQLLDELPPEGWFRLRYALPAGTPRGLRLGIPAEAEFFLDGRRLEPLARVNGHLIGNQVLTVTGFSHYLLPLPADDRQHLLAIHFKGLGSDHPAAALLPMTLSLVQVEPVNDLIDHQRFALTISFHRNLFMAVCFSFTLIHLLLYLGYRAFKPNLHYAGMTLTSGLLCMLFFDIFVTHDFGWWMTLQRLATPLLALNMFACMSLAHVLTVGRARTTPYIAAFFLALSTWGFLQPFLVFEVQGSVVLVAFGEVLRVLYLVKRGKVRVAVSGGGVLVVGALPAMAAFLYQLAVFNLPIEPIAGFFEFPVLFYSGLPLMLAMSLFLSRHFAKTNQDLILRLEEIESLNRKVVAQEVEQARLEGENERTTQELEAARNLQLSLLPQTMPRLPGFTVSTVMKTATEVGGDYYDVEVNGGDPVLTIGDATGH